MPCDITRISLRIDFAGGGRLGPGKVQLLETVAAQGSIAAAGRTLGMSYKRAWTLVDQANRLFGEPLLLVQQGGVGGGGASLTPLGSAVVRHYRAVEASTLAALAQALPPKVAG